MQRWIICRNVSFLKLKIDLRRATDPDEDRWAWMMWVVKAKSLILSKSGEIDKIAE